ncbi:glyoxylase-like metal-dependent hydrolase (beta-lactamase superfamily II) [Geomicrobium halophilum]|uniref:Glyoxylase-like metal-dependent hydrolase (Beta-lactamase superfamily II) n=1 Tax=Geomicrobium halophilum TaxID=549000 RepID=A0A841PS25_9BACL|nr:MBL fold metallo-hydrolase [Geomicrobium halophilum]MBB6449091.1 glyoxylase-like metal-dependent hydrolase (beta-lactamase superfamily II) [Geomicrobium halophilum]
MEAKVEQLAKETYMIDGYDLNLPERTGIYVLDAKELTLIETGPSLSYPQIKSGLKQLGKSLADIQHIIVTHVHLDHAGGCGQLLKETPQATVHVHPKGQKHLVSPEKLVQGAKEVYGSHFDSLFNPIVPIPEECTKACKDGDHLEIGDDRKLTFIDTPGHAFHHLSIIDHQTNGIFTGDTVGIYYQGLSHHTPLFLPSTSPSQFDPKSMKTSWERIKSLNPDRIYFGHFGSSDQVSEIFKSTAYWLEKWIQMTKEAAENGNTPEEISNHLFQSVYDAHAEHTEHPDDHSAWEALKLDCQVSALGLYHAHIKGRLY